MPFGVQRGWMRYALPRPEILSYPLETNVIDSVVLNSSGVAPDTSGPYMNRRYLVAGTVLSKRPDGTYERYTAATNVSAVADVQKITINDATGGTWKAAFEGASTGDLAYDISGANLETALRGLSTIDADGVTVSLSGTTYTVTFANAQANIDQPNIEVDSSSLTGTGDQSITHEHTARGQAAEATQNVAGVLFDTVEFADGSELSDEPVAMVRRNVSFKKASIVDFVTHESDIVDGLPTCEFV